MEDRLTSYNIELSRAFDQSSSNYEQQALEKINLRGYSYATLAQQIVNDLRRYSATDHVIEIGTGPGTLGKRIRSVAKDINTFVGIDISKGMLTKAIATKAYDEMVCCPADKYIFPPESTAIISAFAFHSVEHINTLLHNIAQLQQLRILVVVDLYPSTINELCKSELHSKEYECGAPSNYMMIDAFTRLIQTNGLTVDTQVQLGINKDYNHWKTVILPKIG